MKLRSSYLQERLWFLETVGNLDGQSSGGYHLPLLAGIEGNLDISALNNAFGKLLRRHEVLRTNFVVDAGRPLQRIADEVQVAIELTDLSSREMNQQDAVVEAMAEIIKPFSIETDPLIRAAVYRLNAEHHLLAIGIHHLIADGKSLSIFLRDLFSFYNEEKGSANSKLPGIELQFADFSEWQNDLPGDQVENQLFYWRKKINGQPARLELPTDRPRTHPPLYNVGYAGMKLSADLSGRLTRKAEEHGVSVEILLLASLQPVLAMYTGQSELVTGIEFDSRMHDELKHATGPFSNVLPACFSTDVFTVADLVRNVADECRQVEKHKMLACERLVREMQSMRNLNGAELFDVIFRYEERPLELQPATENLRITRIETNQGLSRVNIDIRFINGPGGVECVIAYNRRCHDATSLERFLGHYRNAIEAFCADVPASIAGLRLTNEKEFENVIRKFNDTATAYPIHETIISRFEEQVKRFPEKTALIAGDKSMSYATLNNEATRIGNMLVAEGVMEGELVGVLMEQSPELITALLGILKAGGAYVPVDANYPQDRINHILSDSGCRILLTETGQQEKFSELPVQCIYVDQLQKDIQEEKRPVRGTPDTPAYVIYTSGTTGKPKGCVISNRNVLRLMVNDRHPFDFTEHDVWIIAHSVCFDFSVWEMYGALLYGGSLVIPSRDEVRDVTVFSELIRKHRVTVLNQTPASFYNFIEEELSRTFHSLSEHLRYVIFGGDKLEMHYLNRWVEKYPLNRVALINMFGITETTVHVTFYRIRKEDLESTYSPVGKPLPGTRVYILGANREVLPVGVYGELYVGGSGVALGYLNREDLTAERFPDDPFFPGEKMYRSGDTGRWKNDGSIEYLGRNDHQVKIRGYRIELGEIENAFLNFPGVSSAVVAARDAQTGKYLVAYYVTAEKENLPVAEMRNHLRMHLPDYMVPGYFVRLANIPMSQNGKIDRKALPDPQSAASGEKAEYVIPRNDLEKQIAESWQQLLGRDKVSIHDSFFDIGGDSIKVVALFRKYNELLPGIVRIADLFSYPTISQQAELLKSRMPQEQEQSSQIQEMEF
jgi:fengycin family lipopeptide synthetase B